METTRLMPGIEGLLTTKLSEDGHRLWAESWMAVVSRILARAVLESFDATSGRLVRPLPPVNDVLWRVRTVNRASDIAVLCERELMQHFDILNAVLTATFDNSGRLYKKRTKPRMQKHLRMVQGA